MNVQFIENLEQHLSPLLGRVVGFVDTKEQLDELLEALRPAGFSRSEVIVFSGEQGRQSLEHIRREIHMGEDESNLVLCGIQELEEGHFGVEIAVGSQNEARLLTDTAMPIRLHHATYFGPWFNMRLS